MHQKGLIYTSRFLIMCRKKIEPKHFAVKKDAGSTESHAHVRGKGLIKTFYFNPLMFWKYIWKYLFSLTQNGCIQI